MSFISRSFTELIVCARSFFLALVQLFAIAEITGRALGTDVPAASSDVQRFARPLGALTIAFSFVVLLIGMSL